MKKTLAAAVALALAGIAAADVVQVRHGGRMELTTLGLTLEPVGIKPDWNRVKAGGGFEADAEGRYPIEMAFDGGAKLKGHARFTATGDGAVEVDYALSATAALQLMSVIVNCNLPFAAFAGCTLAGDATAVPVPDKPGGAKLLDGHFRRFAIRAADGTERLAVEFPAPSHVYVQDSRQWGPQWMELRLALPGGSGALAAGSAARITFRLRGESAIDLQRGPVEFTAGKDWIPVHVIPDIKPGSALDFSKMRRTAAPAGAFGRVVAKGQNFEFAALPGVAQRFYGVNICFDANIPEPDAARRFAATLARTGYNAVRIHHYEQPLTRGSADGTTLNAANLAKFDALVAACVENGLYLTTDLFTSRNFVPFRAVGIDRDGVIPQNDFKVLVQLHEGLFQNYLKFARAFLTHRNAVTGRTLAEEPALGWIALVNEGTYPFAVYRKHEAIVRPQWTAWLAAKKAAEPAAFAQVTEEIPADANAGENPQVKAFTLFLQEVETKFAARVTKYLREELKCPALLTSMNCWPYTAPMLKPRAECYDYIDAHFYVDHPEFVGAGWGLPSTLPNVNPMAGPQLGSQPQVCDRVLNRPMTITEYNYCAPGRYRGVGGIALGATAALQNWAGLWRFAWTHDLAGVTDWSRKAMDYFDMAGDPLGLAAERASICLFLRRDLPELKRTVAQVLDPKRLATMEAGAWHNMGRWSWAGWYAKAGLYLGDAPEADWIAFDRLESVRELPMGGGAVSIDPKTGTFLIDTPRTCGGFAEKGTVTAGALTAKLEDSFATVWVSALDGAPVRSSERLLLTHLTDVQNSGTKFADTGLTTLLKWGTVPHLMRRGAAKISLQVAPGDWRVHSLETDGTRRARVPCAWENGRLVFIVRTDSDPAAASYLYEISRQ